MRETHYHEYKDIICTYTLYKYPHTNKQACFNISLFLVLNCRRYHSAEFSHSWNPKMSGSCVGKVYTSAIVTCMVKQKNKNISIYIENEYI